MFCSLYLGYPLERQCNIKCPKFSPRDEDPNIGSAALGLGSQMSHLILSFLRVLLPTLPVSQELMRGSVESMTC